MDKSKPPAKCGWISRLITVVGIRKKPATVPAELQQAINECNSLEQLAELLYATDFQKDEAILKAFDRRITQLEQQSQ